MPPGAYMPAGYVSDIETFVVKKYPGQKFIIVGHSTGGQIATPIRHTSVGTCSAPAFATGRSLNQTI